MCNCLKRDYRCINSWENDPYLKGYTGIKDISVDDLRGKNGEVLDIIVDGILKGTPFLWKK